MSKTTAQIDREIAQVLELPREVLKKWRSRVTAYKRAIAQLAAGYTEDGFFKAVRARDALDTMIYDAIAHVPYVVGRVQHQAPSIQALERERRDLVSSTWQQAQEAGLAANQRARDAENKRLCEEEREARRDIEWMRH